MALPWKLKKGIKRKCRGCRKRKSTARTDSVTKRIEKQNNK